MPRATQLGEGYRGPSGPTGYLLRQLIHAFHTTQEQGLRPYGLSSPQFGALFVLDHEPGLSSADLARAMGVTPQAANLLVAGMERDGLVRREPHPTHKRVLETYPTDEGLRRMRAAQAFIGDLEERLLAGLGPAERELVHRWLVTAAHAASQGSQSSVRDSARRSGKEKP
jgi:DNA-binding MarR family transcriptional regulator